MKRYFVSLFSLLVLSFLFTSPSTSIAQGDKVRPSLKASVTQRLGTDADITFDFSRPGVKGRIIWGDLVPYGMSPGNEYSKEKPFPWRAGANENTTITTNKDLMVEGKKLAAGKYSIHMIPSEKNWVVIFNKKNEDWGSYSYDEKEDALRVTVTPVEAAHQEWLTFGFDDLAGNSATAFLHWEKLKVPFKMELSGK